MQNREVHEGQTEQWCYPDTALLLKTRRSNAGPDTQLQMIKGEAIVCNLTLSK